MRRFLRQLERLQRLGDVLEGRDPSAAPDRRTLVEIAPGVWASPAQRRRTPRLLQQVDELGELHRKLKRGFNDARDVLKKVGDL